MRRILLALCVPGLAATAFGDMVTERWGQASGFRHGESVTYTPAAEGGVVARFDLSVLPKGTKVYRARLLLPIPPQAGPMPAPVVICPLTKPHDENSAPAVEDKPLALVSPQFASWDATDVVTRWVAARLDNNGLLVRSPVNWPRTRACLEITYEGRLSDPPPPVTGLRAFVRAGQVFLTWKEVETPFAGKDEVAWDQLKAEQDRIKGGRGRIITYRIYRHTKPITARTIAEAELADEVPQHSIFDEGEIRTEWKGEQIKNVRVGEARVPRVAVEPEKELPVGTGLFVTTCRQDGAFHYAVVSAADGVENTTALDAGNTAGPLGEQVASPEPVLYATTQPMYQRNRPLSLFLLYTDPPVSHVPGFIHLGVIGPAKPGQGPAPMVVNGHWWSSGWAISMTCPVEDGVGLTLDTHWILHKGIHEGCGTYKAFSQGKVQDYYVRQLRSLLPWLRKNYNTDPERMYAVSTDWAWHHPDLFAATFEVCTTNPKRSPTAWNSRLFWGEPRSPAPTEWGISAWDYYDMAGYVAANPQTEFPFVTWTAYQHRGDFGWLDKPRLFRALFDTKRPFAACFEEGGMIGVMSDPAWIFGIRRSDPLAAFANCTLDDSPGIGAGFDPGGQLNGWLCLDTSDAVDAPDRWEMTVYLYPGGQRHRPAPLDSCTADLTPRRCRKFKGFKEGDAFRWTNTSVKDGRVVQTGSAKADTNGLVTLQGVIITKDRNRIAITR